MKRGVGGTPGTHEGKPSGLFGRTFSTSKKIEGEYRKPARGGVRRGGEQKKQDKSQERVKPHGPAREEKPSVSFGKEGARQIPGGTAG